MVKTSWIGDFQSNALWSNDSLAASKYQRNCK